MRDLQSRRWKGLGYRIRPGSKPQFNHLLAVRPGTSFRLQFMFFVLINKIDYDNFINLLS